jgi:predicted ATPase/DNA-binding winged helix-turn-helix (wHTH) protein
MLMRRVACLEGLSWSSPQAMHAEHRRIRAVVSMAILTSTGWLSKNYAARKTGGVKVAFGSFELDTDAVELRHVGETVALEPRVFDVLAFLVRHRDRVVPKEELLDEVWGHQFVSESALSSCIRHVRRVLGDDGAAQRCIRTAHGRGYRFVARVTSVEIDAGTGSWSAVDGPAAHNLPLDRTPLFGREDAIGAAVGAVAAHRLVTLLGIGGAGKTRLAVAVGRRVVERFADGVWFVDLVAVDDEPSVVVAIAHACGVALSPGDARAQLARALADRRTLLILDRAEHARLAVATVVDHLLGHTSAPCFMATSREPLGLPGERYVRVTPLSVGTDGAGPAIELFLASAERFGVSVERVDLDVVRRICEQLDGLPLAIELAAAQLRVLGPSLLAERLDRRFELLRAPRASPGDRHASLMSVLEDTWALLDETEMAVLGRLAAFPGLFAVPDVEQLCQDVEPGEVVSTLGRLVDRSLVIAAPVEPRRFRLLDTVRAFARERTDWADAAELHAAWCLDRVGADVDRHLFDFALAAWCADHFDDVRVAEHHLSAGGRRDEAALLTSATALAMYCDEGARAASVLDRVEGHLRRVEDAGLRARLHCTGAMAAMAARSPGDIAAHGRAAVEEARRAGDLTVLAVALVLASWSTVLSDPAAALAMVDEASATATADGRARDHAAAYGVFHLAMQRRYDEALAQADDVIERSSDLEDGGLARFVAVVAWSACNVLAPPAVSGRYLDELLTRPSPSAPMWGNEVLAATICASAGDGRRSARLAARVRERMQRAGQDPLPDLLVPAATLAHRRGDDRLAARWVRAVRDADRPTQSFQVTCSYRRLRDAVGISEVDPLASATLEQIADEALTWMAGEAQRCG